MVTSKVVISPALPLRAFSNSWWIGLFSPFLQEGTMMENHFAGSGAQIYQKTAFIEGSFSRGACAGTALNQGESIPGFATNALKYGGLPANFLATL